MNTLIITLIVLYLTLGIEIIGTYNREFPQSTTRFVYLVAILLWPLISLTRFICYLFEETS